VSVSRRRLRRCILYVVPGIMSEAQGARRPERRPPSQGYSYSFIGRPWHHWNSRKNSGGRGKKKRDPHPPPPPCGSRGGRKHSKVLVRGSLSSVENGSRFRKSRGGTWIESPFQVHGLPVARPCRDARVRKVFLPKGARKRFGHP